MWSGCVVLMLALLVNTVSGECQCFSDVATETKSISIGADVRDTFTFECNEAPVSILRCQLTINSPPSTTLGVGFLQTNLDNNDQENNIAALQNSTGAELASVTTTGQRPLIEITGDTPNTAVVAVSFDATGSLTIEFIATVKNDQSSACTTGPTEITQTITVTNDLCISTPNFPETYQPETKCNWVINPGNEFGRVKGNMRFMDTEDECDDADPVEIILSDGTTSKQCGRSFQEDEFLGLSEVKFKSDSGTEQPGFFLCLSFEPCSPDNPCSNGGVCTSTADNTDINCICPDGFGGDRCQTANPCTSSDPCNGGTCTPSDDFSTLTCVCLDGLSGDRCQTADCSAGDPCNGGTCSDTGNTIACTNCPAGFVGDRCQTADCSSGDPCNGGTCSDTGNTIACTNCPAGFVGDRCQTADCSAGDPCNGGTCSDTGNTIACTNCPAGLSGDRCQTADCSAGDPCNGGTCSDTGNTIACTNCPAGFVGDRCQTADCSSGDPCNGGTCEVTDNMIDCTDCPQGLKGDRCEKHFCEDNNPCENERKKKTCVPCNDCDCSRCKGDIRCSKCCTPWWSRCREKRCTLRWWGWWWWNTCKCDYYCSKDDN